MRRHVVIPVDDERTTHLFVEHNDETEALPSGDGPAVVKVERMPVPPDDQLARDIEEVADISQEECYELRQEAYAEERNHGRESLPAVTKHRRADELYALTNRLRAAFHLDTEGK